MVAKKSLFVSDKPVDYIASNYVFNAVVLVWRTQPHHTQSAAGASWWHLYSEVCTYKLRVCLLLHLHFCGNIYGFIFAVPFKLCIKCL